MPDPGVQTVGIVGLKGSWHLLDADRLAMTKRAMTKRAIPER